MTVDSSSGGLSVPPSGTCYLYYDHDDECIRWTTSKVTVGGTLLTRADGVFVSIQGGGAGGSGGSAVSMGLFATIIGGGGGGGSGAFIDAYINLRELPSNYILTLHAGKGGTRGTFSNSLTGGGTLATSGEDSYVYFGTVTGSIAIELRAGGGVAADQLGGERSAPGQGGTATVTYNSTTHSDKVRVITSVNGMSGGQAGVSGVSAGELAQDATSGSSFRDTLISRYPYSSGYPSDWYRRYRGGYCFVNAGQPNSDYLNHQYGGGGAGSVCGGYRHDSTTASDSTSGYGYGGSGESGYADGPDIHGGDNAFDGGDGIIIISSTATLL